MWDLVRDFKQLPSASNESNPLHSILQSLSPYEWRDLHALLTTRTFQHDIIGNLPIELVVAIFKELDLIAPLVCRRVCVRWRDLLNGECQRSLLRRWVSPNDPPLEGEAALTPLEACYLRAEHVQAVMNFRPFQIARYLRLDHTDPSSALRGYDFAVDTFAWIRERSPGEMTVTCRNFRTGQEDEFRGEGREAIMGLALTSKLVGFLTFSGMCYACDLKTRHMRSFQIPSANVKAFAGRATHLVFRLGFEHFGYTVILWDYVTQKSTSFDIRHQMPSAGPPVSDDSTVRPEKHNGLLMESDGRSVVVFDLVANSHETAIQFVRYSPNGNVIKQESLAIEYSLQLPNLRYAKPGQNRLHFAILPCDNDGNFTLTSFVRKWTRTAVLYNEHTDKLSLHEYANPQYHPERQCSWFLWRDVTYCRLGRNQIDVTLYNQTSRPLPYAASDSFNIPKYGRPASDHMYEVSNHRLSPSRAGKPWRTSFFGNGSFILEAQLFRRHWQTRLKVDLQCFEKNIALPRWNGASVLEVPRRDATREDDSDEDASNEDSYQDSSTEDDSDEHDSNEHDSDEDVVFYRYSGT